MISNSEKEQQLKNAPEENQTSQPSPPSKTSEEGLLQYLSNLDCHPSTPDIDNLFRTFINSKTTTTPSTDQIFPLFIPYLDINFQNPSYENTTIFMTLISKGFNSYAEQFLEKSSIPLNTHLKDNTNENCLFKIINSPNEQGKLSLFKKVLHTAKENLSVDNNVDIINAHNNNAYTLLDLALLIGNSDISALLLSSGSDPMIQNTITGDNILHCAVKGKNPYCLNLVLNKVEPEIIGKLISIPNKNNETPAQLAIKMNLLPMTKLLNDALNNLKNNEDNGEISVENTKTAIDLLCCLDGENFEKIFKIIQENYFVNDWNKIYIEHFLELKKEKKYNYELLQKVIEFFLKENEDTDEKIEYHEDKEIYFLNYMIASFRSGDYQKMIDLFGRFMARENKGEYNFIFYVNSSLMFIDLSIKLNLSNFAKYLLDKLTRTIKIYYIQKDDNKNEIIKNEKLLKYLNHLNFFTPNLNTDNFIYDNILNLYHCFIYISQNNYEKAKKIISDVKKTFEEDDKNKKQNTHLITSYNSIIKNFYKVLKIRIDYFNNTQFKFYKHLNSLHSFGLTLEKSNPNLSLQTTLFYYNSIGILNLKEKKYTYAEYCFKQCESLIRQNEMSTYKFLSIILYNISLCYFYTKKYEKCYKILSSLKNVDSLSNNPYLFYRLGLCCLERELQEAKINSQGENINDLVNKILYFPSENESTHSDKRILLINNNPERSTGEDDYNKNMTEAIWSFKQCLLIMKGYTIYIKDLHTTFEKYDSENDNIIKQYNSIYPSVYLNLMFCLLRNEDYNEAIAIAKEFEKYANETNNKNYKFIIDNYLIEAYLRTNSPSKASEIIEKDNSSIFDLKGTFYTENNQLIYGDVSYRIALYINMVKVHLLNEKVEEAKKLIGVILGLVNYQNSKDIPAFVINVIVYYLISTKQIELAIKLLKFRKVPNIFEKI